MATQYTPILKLALPVTGELTGTWGDVVNDNITSMVEQAIAGLATINSWTANSHTLTTANGTTSESRCAMLVADDDGAGNPSAAATIICPNASKLYIVKNISGQTVTLKTAAGTGIAVPNNQTSFLFCDGTNVESCVTSIVDGNVAGNLTVQGNATVNGNTTLGNATSDTVTLTARVASVVSPSADNTYDLGSVANSWKDLYIDGTAYLALVDINGGAIDGTTIGGTTPAAGSFTTLSSSGTTTFTALTASQAVFTNASDQLVSNAITGTGNVVMSASPTLTGTITAAGITASGDIVGNGNWTIGNADTDTITVGASFVTGSVLRSAKVATNTLAMAAYDVDGAAYTNLVTLTASNTPTLALTSTGVGSIDNMAIGATTPSTVRATQVDITAQGDLRLQDTTGGEYVALQAPGTLASSYTLTLPVDDGTAGQALLTDGNGVLSWGTAASGDVVGPASATDNAIARFDGTTGKIIQNSGATISDANNLSVTTINNATAAALDFNNTVFGSGAFASNSFSFSNCAIGFQALYSNTNGGSNTGVGALALYSNASGGNNTAIGASALYYTAGSWNTGNDNTGVGVAALRYNTTGNNNVAVGSTALYSNTSASASTAVGYQALYSNTTGTNNSTLGFNALYSNTTGNNNVAVGNSALYSNTSSNNTGVGDSALYSNTTGTSNTANGYRALYFNTLGSDNVAVGNSALYSNTASNNNTGVGSGALSSNTGSDNTSVGYRSLYSNTSSSANTAFGKQALYSNTTATYNTALGYEALYGATTGQYNVGVGANVFSNLTTGSGNAGIGHRTSTGSVAPVFNVTTENNRIVMGHTSVTNAYVQVAWTVVSDARDKTQIAPLELGLAFVQQLNPVSYKFRINRNSEETNGNKRYGFLAQEVLEVEGADNVIVDTEDPEKLKMTNEELIPILVNAIKEMSVKMDAMQSEINLLKGV